MANSEDKLPGQSRADLAMACLKKHADFFIKPGEILCGAVFDTFLCWPPTPAGAVASQHCPTARLSDTSRFAYRQCNLAGKWLGRKANESNDVGWTNFTPCFPAEVQTLFTKVYEDNERDAQLKFLVAQRTRYMEIVGFTMSLFALMISFGIFSYFRSLRNNRTRIHKNLFAAMIIQVLLRLIVYIDQARIRSYSEDVTIRGIENMPYVCEAAYILLEHAITVMFMWMFIEGLYLHNMVTANALRNKISYKMYYATGWGLPVVLTVIWATVTAINYQEHNIKTCWYGYNFSNFFWIMQGPRVAVIMTNLFFLLNIMRVLIVKLRQSQNTEVEKVRKAVKAALVLLPLLGITNILNMTESPIDGSVLKFAIWSYTTHLLRSFQGFFIALIYCFLNGEVRKVIKKHISNYMAMRGPPRRRVHLPWRVQLPWNSLIHFVLSRGGRRGPRNRRRDQDVPDEADPSWIPMRRLNHHQRSSNIHIESSIERHNSQCIAKRFIPPAPEVIIPRVVEPQPYRPLRVKHILEPIPNSDVGESTPSSPNEQSYTLLESMKTATVVELLKKNCRSRSARQQDDRTEIDSDSDDLEFKSACGSAEYQLDKVDSGPGNPEIPSRSEVHSGLSQALVNVIVHRAATDDDER